MRKARTIALTAGAGALSAALVAAMATAAPAATSGTAKPATPVIHVRPGVKVLTQAKALSTPWTTALCRANLNIACWDPSQIRTVYNTGPLLKKGITGKGSTIVIVDSFGSPTIKNDLHVFDTQFGFPDPPSLKVIQPAGPVP